MCAFVVTHGRRSLRNVMSFAEYVYDRSYITDLHYFSGIPRVDILFCVEAPIASLPGFTSLIKGFRRGEMTVLTGPTG